MKGLKEKLNKGEITVGSWITLGHTAIAEIMAKAGFDWLVIDMEHSAICMHEAQQLIQTIELSGNTPLVRVGVNDPLIIKRVMDAGAHGVIVPMVNSKEDAIRAVEAVKYPPSGKRGVGLARAQGYGLDFQGYKQWVNKNSVVIVQIEHVDAIKNLEDILGVDGIDGSIIGPYDLSASIGYPGEFERKAVKDLIGSYVERCGKLGKSAGFHVVDPDPGKFNKKIKEGFNFLAFGFDALFLGTACRDGLSTIKKERPR
ncbi:MAG: aldolase/citrate lyase family protein [Candidatus Omnitrophica bacterium]|nr:aldolase/citrate lyase family protein [Candidatus Omnitrophota bacterium]